jgi:hypothetical protein
MIDYAPLRAEAALHLYPLLFATISGAHLYGFPSPDSDYDMRGVHLLPAGEALGLLPSAKPSRSAAFATTSKWTWSRATP